MHYFCMKSNTIAQNSYSYPLNEGNALLLLINNLALHSNWGLWVLHTYFTGDIIPLHDYLGPTLLFLRRKFYSLHVYSGMHAYFFGTYFPPAWLFGTTRLLGTPEYIKGCWCYCTDIQSGGSFQISYRGCSHGTLGFQLHSSWIQYYLCSSVLVIHHVWVTIFWVFDTFKIVVINIWHLESKCESHHF